MDYKHKRKWGHWVQRKRKAKDLTRRDLAELASIDPSYMTLIERDGFVPRRDTVERIGAALYLRDEAMFRAGYLPDSYDPEQVQAGLEAGKVLQGLEAGLRFELLMLCDLPPSLQAAASGILSAFRESHKAGK